MRKPIDNIGTKTIPDDENYARSFMYDIEIPGCAAAPAPAGAACPDGADHCDPPPAARSARVFVGQRKEGFAVNIGQIFDLLHFNTDGATGDGHDAVAMRRTENTS